MMNKNKQFDAVKMMRDIREKINVEIAGMNTEQLLDYFNKSRQQYEREVVSHTGINQEMEPVK